MRDFQLVTGSEARLPERKTAWSAGYDFYLPKTVTIKPQETVFIPSGVKAYMGTDEVLTLYIRSSLAIKRKLTLVNGVGVVDSDYYNNTENEGNILIVLRNEGTHDVTLEKGERVMQGIFTKYLTCGEDVRRIRTGGIGSTNE
ncbi:MAG: dUTP diphosphatase [Tissierellia bacterium]|jgi:dUTP pyrophosphatase|nr:dUTP diphosphatase [Tissierellia bacterium]